MQNHISKMGSHVYAKNGKEAVELYKKAFLLEESPPWLDDDGLIIHQDLLRNGERFLSVSDAQHLPDGFISRYGTDVCPSMLFYVYFHNEEDLRRAFALLREDGCLHTAPQAEGEDLICEVIDRFGVFWHLRFHKNWNADFIPK